MKEDDDEINVCLGEMWLNNDRDFPLWLSIRWQRFCCDIKFVEIYNFVGLALGWKRIFFSRRHEKELNSETIISGWVKIIKFNERVAGINNLSSFGTGRN